MNWLIVILTSTVVSAAVSVTGSWIIQNKKIHAEIVSKARHQWIQEVRALLSEYITELGYLNKEVGFILDDEDEKFTMPFANKIKNPVKKINTLCNKIILYFGEVKIVNDEEIEDKNNVSFNNKITELNEIVNKLHHVCMENGKFFQENEYNPSEDNEKISNYNEQIENQVNELIKESSKYIKTEWYNTKKQK